MEVETAVAHFTRPLGEALAPDGLVQLQPGFYCKSFPLDVMKM